MTNRSTAADKAASPRQVLLFSDLDGCLLDKQDYSFAPAVATLKRAQQAQIPVVLASSKTEPEMRLLADEMELPDAPLIIENGGAIIWSRLVKTGQMADSQEANRTLLGTDRQQILDLLANLKSEYRFRSFADLGVAGVCESTGLPEQRAAMALSRSSTEPLLWDDAPEKLDEFAMKLSEHSLSFTRGGRFWHVAGQTTKGKAMALVATELTDRQRGNGSQANWPVVTIAIGDSPIDQSMLDIADYPIAIPTPGGVVQVAVTGDNARTASLAGPAGWAEAVGDVLDELTC